MNNPKFPILFATDKGYTPHLATALYSLLRNNRDINIRVVIFTGGIAVEDQEKLSMIAGGFGVELEFIELNDSIFDELVLNYHFKKSNYYRLYAADLIKGESCLYLDADIIVTGSIKEIIEANLDSYYLAAVDNPGFDRHEELGMHPASKYFNSGVMLLNLDKWRRYCVKDRVIALTKEKPEAILFVDQCGLNAVVDGKWLELDPRFNCQSYIFASGLNENCLKGNGAVIVHFTGSGKPWHMNNKHPYKKLYWEYRNKTPYRSNLPDDFGFKTAIRYLTPKFAKNLLKRIIGKSPQ